MSFIPTELESDQLDARRVGSDEVKYRIRNSNRPTLIALLGKTNMLGDYLAEVAQRSKQTNAAIVILMTNSEERGELDMQLPALSSDDLESWLLQTVELSGVW